VWHNNSNTNNKAQSLCTYEFCNVNKSVHISRWERISFWELHCTFSDIFTCGNKSRLSLLFMLKDSSRIWECSVWEELIPSNVMWWPCCEQCMALHTEGLNIQRISSFLVISHIAHLFACDGVSFDTLEECCYLSATICGTVIQRTVPSIITGLRT
jgi:hypothetical protein